jgi:inhibitor of growth protein 3
MDRYVKRLDIKLRDLQTEGAMPIDHSMPSLLRDSPGNLVPPSSTTNTGANTPLQPLSLNTTGGQANVAQAAINQVTRAISSTGTNSPMIGMQPHPLLNRSHLANVQTVAAMQLSRSQREMSASSERKRPRPEGTLGTLPARPSNLGRQSSLGPGTPKAGTPGGSRAGSAGPRPAKRPVAGKRPDLKLSRKKTNKHGLSKKVNRRLNNPSRASPSTTGDDSVASEDGSEGENDRDHDMDSADADDDGADNTKYCYCQRVSYGDMVACDNADCKNQWFHWGCAGLDHEPVGDWLCRDCAKLPKSKIRKA